MNAIASKRNREDVCSYDNVLQSNVERVARPRSIEKPFQIFTVRVSKYGFYSENWRGCDWSDAWAEGQKQWTSYTSSPIAIENRDCTLLREFKYLSGEPSARVMSLKVTPRTLLMDYAAGGCLHIATSEDKSSDLEANFNRLVRTWKQATGYYSITTRRYAHASYQEMLVMGKAIIPLILRELQERPDWWFEALKALTKEDPTKPTDNFHAAVESWVRWGKERNLIP